MKSVVLSLNAGRAAIAGALAAVVVAGFAGAAFAQSAKDAVPAELKKKGVVNIAMTLDYAPYSWLDGKSPDPTGIDVDVGLAVGAKLGLKWNIINSKWEGLLTGVGSGRFDAGAGGTSDIEEREKIVTFIDYATSSDALIILADNKDKYKTVDALCGLSVGALKGTTTVTTAEAANKDECTSKGKPAMKINVYSSVPDADLALKSGRDVAQVGSTEQAAYQIKAGEVPWHILKGGLGGNIPNGFYISAKNHDFAKAIHLALTELYKDGTLKTIATKYGLEGSLMEPKINAATAK